MTVHPTGANILVVEISILNFVDTQGESLRINRDG